MITAIATHDPTDSPELILDHIRDLEGSDAFSWFVSRVAAKRDVAKNKALARHLDAKEREEALIEYSALEDVLKIISSEADIAKDQIKEKESKEENR